MRFVAFVLMLLVSGQTAAEEAWKALKPDGLGFTITLPKDTPVKEETVDIGNGQKAKVSTLQLLSPRIMYDVTVVDYPKGALPADEAQVLDNARDGAVNNAPGPLITETKIEVEGRPARELLIDMSMDLHARNRIFLVGDRLYSIGAVTNKNNMTSPDVEKYFASFKLTP